LKKQIEPNQSLSHKRSDYYRESSDLLMMYERKVLSKSWSPVKEGRLVAEVNLCLILSLRGDQQFRWNVSWCCLKENNFLE